MYLANHQTWHGCAHLDNMPEAKPHFGIMSIILLLTARLALPVLSKKALLTLLVWLHQGHL